MADTPVICVSLREEALVSRTQGAWRFSVQSPRRSALEKLALQIGLRRTSGLRSEELALLDGVSVRWYTWLERGRDNGVSSDVLERRARVLRVDRAEAAHLFALSSRQSPLIATDDEQNAGLVNLSHAIDPVPAYVRTRCLDIPGVDSRGRGVFPRGRYVNDSLGEYLMAVNADVPQVDVIMVPAGIGHATLDRAGKGRDIWISR